MALRHKELTGRILKAYYEVWNHTARVYPEYLYESCLLRELGDVSCVRQDEYEILYKGFKVGSQRLDMFVAGEVVVELKVAPELTKLHKAQAISYIKVVQKHDGLLLNFGGNEPGFARLFYDEPAQAMHPDTIHKMRESPEYYAPDLTYEVQGALYEVFSHLGPGFIHRIYGNACYRELTQRGLKPIARNNLEVIYKGQPAGTIKFQHLQVADILIFPVALTNSDDIPIKIIKEHLTYYQLPLAILANFYTTTLSPTIIYPKH